MPDEREGEPITVPLAEADDIDDDAPGEAIAILVWPDAEDALEVFRMCSLQGLPVGMAGVLWTGVSAQEIESACTLRGFPRDRWREISEDVHYMAAIICGDRNRKLEAQARRR